MKAGGGSSKEDLMAQFINAKKDIVTQAIDGVLASSNGLLKRLDGYPHIKVVLRSDWDKSKAVSYTHLTLPTSYPV